MATPEDVLTGRARWCVVRGDCLQVMPTLPEKSVAHVIADPPYSEHTHSKQWSAAALTDRGERRHTPDKCHGVQVEARRGDHGQLDDR